jgi:hypothetical protein
MNCSFWLDRNYKTLKIFYKGKDTIKSKTFKDCELKDAFKSFKKENKGMIVGITYSTNSDDVRWIPTKCLNFISVELKQEKELC